jgi:hypothetical protein
MNYSYEISHYRQDCERAGQIFPDLHDSSGVVELAAVVRRREESDQAPLVEKLVAVLDNLIGEKTVMIIHFLTTVSSLRQAANFSV